MELPPHAQGRRSQLSQDVASYVRELIISGRARRDDYLRIDTIAKAMGISSTPVREGLLMLQLEGFVKLVPRHGFRVVGVEPQDVLDIFWAQGVLAGELAARAAMRASEDEISELRQERAKLLGQGAELDDGVQPHRCRRRRRRRHRRRGRG